MPANDFATTGLRDRTMHEIVPPGIDRDDVFRACTERVRDRGLPAAKPPPCRSPFHPSVIAEVLRTVRLVQRNTGAGLGPRARAEFAHVKSCIRLGLTMTTIAVTLALVGSGLCATAIASAPGTERELSWIFGAASIALGVVVGRRGWRSLVSAVW